MHVKAGETVSVNLYPSLSDFSLTGADGTKRATEGEWTVKFGVAETAEHASQNARIDAYKVFVRECMGCDQRL